MSAVLQQALLVLAVASLAGAAFRTASLAAPSGLERLVAAAPLAAAAAAGETLLLGRLGLSGSPLARALLAVATWLACHLLVPAPLSALDELRRWTRSRPPSRRAPWLALAGAVAGAAAWAEWRPTLGYDGATYHLSEAVIWVQEGTAGSVEPLIAGLPVGNYPVTNEVLVSWALGLSQSFAPLAGFSAFLVFLFVASSWLALRALEVPRVVAVLGIACLCFTPLVLREISHASETDFAALAWLAGTAGLAAASVRRPALLAPAVVAAGLAVGTKTTTLPLAVLALGAAFIAARGGLGGMRTALALAGVGALVAGGLWYLRNLLDHGSPLWPLVAAPWGDPVPSNLARLDVSLLSRPAETLEAAGTDFYVDQLGGMLLVLAACLTVPLWARRRDALLAAGAAVLAALLWANAPFTGTTGEPAFAGVPLNALRYATPALAAAVAAMAIAARTGARAKTVATTVLSLALAWNTVRYLDEPFLPSDAVLIACMAAGAGGALLLAALGRPRAVIVAAAAAAVAALAFASSGWVERHGRSGELDSGLVNAFAARADWTDGDGPVAASPTVFAAVAGDRLDHPVSLVRPRESCSAIRRRLRDGWIVVERAKRDFFPRLSLTGCLRGLRPEFRDGARRIFGKGSL
jgi:hypothetical protein